MKKKSLKLTGRVVSVNHADQSVLLESTEKSNRLRVYADNGRFKRLNHIITESRFNGEYLTPPKARTISIRNDISKYRSTFPWI